MFEMYVKVFLIFVALFLILAILIMFGFFYVEI